MKIIKRGTIPGDEPFHVICLRCHTEAEAEKVDVRSDQREGAWVNCPVCRTPISVVSTKNGWRQA